MKKIFISTILLFITAFTFAETKFCGISFDIIESKENKKIEDNLEKQFEILFSKFCEDVDVDFNYYDQDKKLNKIKIDFEYKKDFFPIGHYVITYLVDTFNCKDCDGYLFNDDLLIDYYIKDNEFSIEVYDRKYFNSLLKSVMY